jgi:tRNA-dihydrouridine synthase
MGPFPSGFRIRDVAIAPATVLAPMAGVTDTVFRRLIRTQGGCGLLMTEFTSSHGIAQAAHGRKPGRTMKYLVFDPEERPIAAQLFGSDPAVMADAARVCQDLGFDTCGIEAIALHPRTREQGYAGAADWNRIAELKAAVHIPVIGNGDIVEPADAVRMIAETGCDAVMIGRSAATNPWIFRQVAEYIETGDYFRPSDQDRYLMMRTYYAMLAERDDPDGIGKMKQFATLFTHGIRNGSHLRTAVHRSKSVPELLDSVDRFFEAHLDAVPA